MEKAESDYKSLPLICGYIYHMIKTYQGFNRKQKILEEYHEFSMQVLDWSKEIKDIDKSSELLKELRFTWKDFILHMVVVDLPRLLWQYHSNTPRLDTVRQHWVKSVT